MFDSSNTFWLVVSNICYFSILYGLSSFPLTNSYFSRCFSSPPQPTSNPFIGQSLPSGKRLHHYGKSPCLNGKIHYFYGHFQWQSLFFVWFWFPERTSCITGRCEALQFCPGAWHRDDDAQNTAGHGWKFHGWASEILRHKDGWKPKKIMGCLPSGKLTACYWKWPSPNSGFSH